MILINDFFFLINPDSNNNTMCMDIQLNLKPCVSLFMGATLSEKKISQRKKILSFQNTVDSRNLEIEGTLKNTTRYPYFDISDL